MSKLLRSSMKTLGCQPLKIRQARQRNREICELKLNAACVCVFIFLKGKQKSVYKYCLNHLLPWVRNFSWSLPVVGIWKISASVMYYFGFLSGGLSWMYPPRWFIKRTQVLKKLIKKKLIELCLPTPCCLHFCSLTKSVGCVGQWRWVSMCKGLIGT